MDNNKINNQSPLNQNIENFKKLGKSFSNRDGHQYLVVKNNQLVLSNKRSERSSLRKINTFMQKMLDSNPNISNEDKLAIFNSYHILTQKFENKKLTGLSKIFLSGKKTQQVIKNKTALTNVTNQIKDTLVISSNKAMKNLIYLVKNGYMPYVKNIEIDTQNIKDNIVKEFLGSIKSSAPNIKINKGDIPLIIWDKTHSTVTFNNLEESKEYLDSFSKDAITQKVLEIPLSDTEQKDTELAKAFIEKLKQNQFLKVNITCTNAWIKQQLQIKALGGIPCLSLNGIDYPTEKHNDPKGFLGAIEKFLRKGNLSDAHEVYRYIWTQGLGCELEEGDTKHTPLTLLSSKDNLLLEKIIEYASKDDLEKTNSSGQTPLQVATKNQANENIKTLTNHLNSFDI